MITKRIFGVVFILLAGSLTIAIIGLIPNLFHAVFGFFNIFTGKLNTSQIGEITGHITYWVFHISVTIALWIYGLRWTKKEIKA